MANLKDINYGIGKYLELSDASAIPDIGTNRKNIDLLNFKVATNNAYALYNFKDGMIDAYVDETGVDTGTSTNETYNATEDLYSPTGGNTNMTLVSNAQTAQADPIEGRLMLYEEDVDACTPGTDIKGYVSRDGGTTWSSAVGLTDDGYYETFNQGGIDSNTGLMLHMDGANDGVIFTDNSDSPHTITVGGDTHTDTAVKKFGTASAQFDGTGDYLSAPDSSDWNMFANTSDSRTLDFWVNHTSVSSGKVYFMAREAGSDYWYINHLSGTDIKVYGKIGDSVFIDSSGTAFSNTGAWHHIALVKVANVVALYVDGTQITYATFSTTRDFAAILNIGSQDGDSDFYNGYMDEVRWSNSNPFSATPNSTPDDTITVPTAAYSTGAAQTNQRILSGSIDISGQPAGSNMKYKVETLNTKDLKLHGASLLWA